MQLTIGIYFFHLSGLHKKVCALVVHESKYLALSLDNFYFKMICTIMEGYSTWKLPLGVLRAN